MLISNWSILAMACFILIVILALCWFLVFDIYEVRYSVIHGEDRTVTIEAIPMNNSGMRVPFRNVECEYFIIGNKNDFNVVSSEINKGIIAIKLLGNEGTLKVEAKPVYSLWTNKIEIPLNNPEEL